MSSPPAALFTQNDIDIALRIGEALIAIASTAHAAPVAYAALLKQARALHPRDAVLGRAVAIGLGPRLQRVAAFCLQHGYPNLAALAVDPVTNLPGPHADGPADLGALAATDWSQAQAQLVAASQAWRAAVPARLKPRGERPADVTWYAWYTSHRAECKDVTPEGKLEIINLVMAGLDPASALRRALDAQAAYGAT